jgi:phage shock protein E
MEEGWPKSFWGRSIAFIGCLLAGCAPEVDGVREVPAQELLEAPPGSGLLVLDVRNPDEYASGHVLGAMNIPHTEIEARIDELAEYRDREIVIYCERGYRAQIAAGALDEAGFQRLGHLVGDMKSWRNDGLPLVRGTP